jgi:hypothetical protein
MGEPVTEIPLDNSLVRDEMAKAGEGLYMVEIEAAAVMGALFGFFMAAIYYNGLPPLVASGFGAIAIVIVYGLKVTLKGIVIERTRARVYGAPSPETDPKK